MCLQLSRNGKLEPPEANLFDIGTIDLSNYYSCYVKHFLQTGLYLIALNSKNQVIAGTGLIDDCEYPLLKSQINKLINDNKIPKNVQRKLELSSILREKIKAQKSKITSNSKMSNNCNENYRYGDCVWFSSAATHPSYSRKGIHWLIYIDVNISFCI